MALTLALAAALSYGVGDFIGGLATRHAAAVPVVLLSQAAGLVALLAVLPALPAADPTAADLAWGAASGVAGGLGLVLLFRSFALGAMGVAAPVTAVCSAGLPVLVGLALGERPGVVVLVGVGLALAAVGLISREDEAAPGAVPLRRVVTVAAAGGLFFGCFYVLLAETGDDAGLWPLAAARGASTLMLAPAVLLLGRGLPAARPSAAACLSGIVDMVANVLYLLALRRGLLSVVPVLTSLYPAATVVLARYLLHERVGRAQLVGFAVAAAAVTMIAAG
jgi:drug/metabolite transporter (DMT)-like permease